MNELPETVAAELPAVAVMVIWLTTERSMRRRSSACAPVVTIAAEASTAILIADMGFSLSDPFRGHSFTESRNGYDPPTRFPRLMETF